MSTQYFPSHISMIQQPRQVTHQLAVVDIFSHGPINHGLATPFLSYRVTLNARKTRYFIRDLIIWQSYKLGPLRQCSDS